MRFAIFVIAILSLAACGYVGDPLPPALKIPTPVSDLAVSQVGQDLFVSFTIPNSTMEGLGLPTLGGLELKIGPNTALPFNPDTWSSQARLIGLQVKEPTKVETKIPAKDWANQEVVIGVRVANPKMRVSPWSNFVTLKVVPPLDKPANLRAIATATGVALDWSNPNPRPAVSWKIFRLTDKEEAATEMATVTTPHFNDTGAAYDTPHKYTVQAFEADATSERSDPVSIIPVDTFPPARPLGLSALAGPAAAQLSWERNQEPDLALYRIYRSNSAGPFLKIADSPTAASFRDAAVVAGQTYRYAVAALDKMGNESPKSEPVEILIP